MKIYLYYKIYQSKVIEMDKIKEIIKGTFSPNNLNHYKILFIFYYTILFYSIIKMLKVFIFSLLSSLLIIVTNSLCSPSSTVLTRILFLYLYPSNLPLRADPIHTNLLFLWEQRNQRYNFWTWIQRYLQKVKRQQFEYN